MNTEKLRASILFVLYNNFDEAEGSLASIAAQEDCADVEVILSDDGSTAYDSSQLYRAAEALKEKGRFADVRVNINEKNLGSVAHFNRLFGLARGEYIVFISPGDRFPTSRTVAGILEDFEKSKAPVLTGRRRDMRDAGGRVRPFALTGFFLKHFPKALMNYMVRRHNLISSCCTAYSKRLFAEYGMPDTRYRLLDDYPYIVRLLQQGARFAFTRRIFLEHAVGGGVSTGESIHPVILKDLEEMQEQLLREPQGLSKATLRHLEKAVAARKKSGD
ncbi:MAG: glycosyltransferase [Lachnospiraceae bacterium]|nr:glycosyltransferase [Lachnospiraceae bacterium]